MRPEYQLMQELVWNAEFRRRFLASPADTIRDSFPHIGGLERFGPTQFPGIEESAYYRIASCCRASKVAFARGHHLILAFGGMQFFEQLLSKYLEAPKPVDAVYEIFDSYILAPEVIRLARSFPWINNAEWIVPVLEYEWARVHSGRVALGWQSLIPARGLLTRGVFLIRADYDLRALFADLDRMIAASVPEEVYRWRASPGRGDFRVAVYPRADQIAEVELDDQLYELLVDVGQRRASLLSSEVRDSLVEAGLIDG